LTHNLEQVTRRHVGKGHDPEVPGQATIASAGLDRDRTPLRSEEPV